MTTANDAIHVVAHLEARPDTTEALTAVARELAEGSRAQSGCLGFQVHRSALEPTRFVTVEHWASADAVDAHMASERVAGVLAKLGPLLAAPPQIVRYTAVA